MLGLIRKPVLNAVELDADVFDAVIDAIRAQGVVATMIDVSTLDASTLALRRTPKPQPAHRPISGRPAVKRGSAPGAIS